MMNRSLQILSCCTVLTGMILGGCANYTQPQVDVSPQSLEAKRFEAYWDTSVEVLRDYRFRIDRRDRRSGVLTTDPMIAQHWFEFWRCDAVTFDDLMEGSLQTVIRRARVNIWPSEKSPGGYDVKVKVEVSRPVLKRTNVVAAGESYEKFTESSERDYYSLREERRDQREELAQEWRRDGLSENQIESKLAELQAEQTLQRFTSNNALAHAIAEDIRKKAHRAISQID